jgi:uncharacterized protein YdaU (DUF1376 family)
MLDAYYLREAPLPIDVAEIARLIRLRDHAAVVRDVLNEFFTQSPEGWRHIRCDEEIEKMQDKQAKARASAAASVNARKAKAQHPYSDSSTGAQRTFNERSTDVQLPTPTPTPTPTPVNTKPRERGPDFVLPDWIDRDHWDAWHSTPKRKKATPQQKQLAIKKLQAWRDQGLDYAGALENAATGGYQGLFLPNQTRANANPNKQEALEARNKAVADEWLREQGAIV